MFGELNSSPRISYTPALVIFSLILQHAKNGAIILFLLLGEFLYGNILAVWVAGTNAINRNIIWHLLNCADKPYTVQRKIQEEIDRVVGQDRQPTWEDRYRMPYSMAAVWEMLRWRPISPLGLPRSTDEDIEIGGYVVPKGAVVMANFWALNMDRKRWEDPEVFNPNRFLDASEQTLAPRPQQFIPFSVGK